MHQEDDFLPLSGIQHFAFCRRQWALIHIEQAWQENVLTIEGTILHEKAHEAGKETRKDIVISRSLQVFSHTLGVRGVCDIVEFHCQEDGIELFGRAGKFTAIPVEYKRGKPKENNADLLQLCAQAICLEEMLQCRIPEGFLFYGETRRRLAVSFTDELRQAVQDMFVEMHKYHKRGYTPKVKTGKHCRACSLADICLPAINHLPAASDYLYATLQGGE